MYYIAFRFKGTTPSMAEIIVGLADLPAVIGVLEAAKSQYKVYRGGACLTPEQFGLGACAGWLSLDATFQ